MKISIIAAMSKNKVIGYNDSIPWHIPEDLKQFKEKTLNKPIIMGRKTFESLPFVLPKRDHIIVSRDASYKTDEPKCSVHDSLIRVLNTIGNLTIAPDLNPDNEAFIIGGQQVFQLALDLKMVDCIYLTYIDADFNGDTFFPDIDKYFRLVSEVEGEESSDKLRYYFRKYERV